MKVESCSLESIGGPIFGQARCKGHKPDVQTETEESSADFLCASQVSSG